MNLSTELLRTFVAVIDTASFTKAGEMVNRSQSAVSQQIKRLEEEFGHKLLERNGREVRPTPHGEELLPHARRLLKMHDEAVASLSRPDISGLVRLGATDDYASGLLPEMLSRFAATHPLVQVEVCCDSSPSLVEAIKRGELDLAVCKCGDLPVDVELLGKEPLLWVTSAQRPAHEQNPIPLAVYDRSCKFRKWAASALDKLGKPYRIAYVSQSLTGLQAAVKAGLAVAVLGGGFIPPGARILGQADGFPPLPAANLYLVRGGDRSEPVERLAATISEGMRQRLDEEGCCFAIYNPSDDAEYIAPPQPF